MRLFKFLTIFFVLITLFNPKQTKSADKHYLITKVDLLGQLNRDGSMAMEESRVFSFTGSYSFAYMNINKKGERNDNYSYLHQDY